VMIMWSPTDGAWTSFVLLTAPSVVSALSIRKPRS